MGIPHFHKPSDDTEAVVTIAAIPGGRIEIEFIGFSYDEAPAAAKLLTIESPASTVLQSYYVTGAGPGPIPMSGSCVRGAVSSAMVVRLAAGGTGIGGSINVIQRQS